MARPKNYDVAIKVQRHDPDTKGNNYLAAEGHVKFLRIEKVSYGNSTTPLSVKSLGSYVMTFNPN